MLDLIIVPAYNEEESLAITMAALQVLPDSFEVLIVNDGSTDRTQEVAEEAVRSSKIRSHLVALPFNCGIGAAVQTGYLFAEKKGIYRYVIQFDADGQHDAAALTGLVRACEEHRLDLCIGSRFLDSDSTGFRSTAQRRLGIRFFTWIIWLLTGVRVTDPTSGLRCAGPRAWRRFAGHYPEDYPEPETLFWCLRNKLVVGEVAVAMKPRQHGNSSIQHLHPVFYMAKVTFAILLDRLRGKEHL